MFGSLLLDGFNLDAINITRWTHMKEIFQIYVTSILGFALN